MKGERPHPVLPRAATSVLADPPTRSKRREGSRERGSDLLAALGAGAVEARSGHLQGIDDEGRLLFRAEGSSEPPVAVAIGAALSDGALVKAARQQQRAVVVRTADPSPRWILVGLMRERVDSKARDARSGELEVRVDGERVQLTAERTIELRCGKSSLTLRWDGKVVLSGTHLVSASRGPNRIKGATIALN